MSRHLAEEILLNVESKEVRCAHLQHGQLEDLIIERKKERQLTGNIYRGHVTNILDNIQSAFVNIAEGDNGFIHISDVIENTKKYEAMFDMDFELDYDISEVKTDRKANLDIHQVLKLDQSVLVQVVKEPIGSKGARLTSNVSVAGRYLVLLPNSKHKGVSRRVEQRSQRERLKKLIRSFETDQPMGWICRTASQGATDEALIEEARELLTHWEEVVEGFQKSDGPALLFEESDLIKRAVIKAVDRRIDRILVDDFETFQKCKRHYQKYADEHPLRIELYRDKVPMFERFNVEREIDKTLKTKLWLNSGGYLFFDRTEAMMTIDVNSGRSQTGQSTIEESLVRINLEAAEEIARQLRLRNIGGLIIIDFIDMRMRKNQRRVLDILKACMKDDTAKATILGMSDFGLVEMTRQRNRGSLMHTIFMECPYCSGEGMIRSTESVSIEVERALKKVIQVGQQFAVRVAVHPEVHHYMKVHDANFLGSLAESLNARVELDIDDNLHLNDFVFYSTLNNQRIEV